MTEPDKQRDLMTRLSDAGEDAIARVTGSQGAARFMESVGGLRDRLDDVQKKLRGLDELEKRVKKLEKQVSDLAKPKRSTSSRSRTSATTRRAAPRKKPPASSS